MFHNSRIELLIFNLQRISSRAASQGKLITDIWFSHTLGSSAVSILDFIFSNTNKPTIHIESLRTSQSGADTISEFLKSVGCISRLKANKYNVQVWDWEKFATKTASPSCDYYTWNQSSYFSLKNRVSKFVEQISNLDSLCN